MSSAALGREEEFLQGPEDTAVCPYLEWYGYRSLGVQGWDHAQSLEAWPAVEIKVTGHTEMEKHTMYYLDCTLRSPSFPSAPLKWRALRRLLHLREGLHDRVKREMDPQVFKKLNLTTFAPRGGMWGTTAALNTWCCNLAVGINKRDVMPRLVAFVLNFVEAPHVAPEVPLSQASSKAGGRTVQFAPPKRHVSVGSVDSETLAFNEFLEGQCRQQGENTGAIDIDFADELDVDLESELESMKISSLQRRAAGAGATPAELRVAQDQDDPKTALIDLIHTKQGGTSETPSDSSDNLPSEAPGMADSVAPMAAPRSVSRVNISDSDDDAPKESNSGGVARKVSGLSGRSSELASDEPTWKLLQEEEAELQRREQERQENEAERERLEVDKLEQERLADRLAVEKAAKEETERISADEEQERLAAEVEAKAEAEAAAKVEADTAKEEADRLAAEQEQERLAKVEEEALRIEEERLAAEKAEADRLAAESAAKEEASRSAAEQEQERLAAEAAAKAEADRLASDLAAKEEADGLEQERLAAEKVEAERLASENAAKVEQERAAAEKAEADRLAAENAAKEEADRLEAEQEQEKLVAEAAAKTEADRLASELEAKEEADRLEQERLAAEKVEAERLAAENAAKVEQERLAAEKAEADKIATEIAAKEEAERIAAEHAAEAAAKVEADRLATELAAKEQVDELVTESTANVEVDRPGPEQAMNERSDTIEPERSVADKSESDRVVENMVKEEEEEEVEAAPQPADSSVDADEF